MKIIFQKSLYGKTKKKSTNNIVYY